MIFPINKKHTFFSKEKTLLTFFFILFISFSAFGQQDKKLILLQTSDVHSRLEPINQEGDRNYDKGGFVRRATFVKEFRKEHPDMLLLGAGSHYRPEMPGTPGAILWLTLFRDKIDDIMEQVKCPVAVFVNRNYREGALVSFVLGGMIDVFLLSYLNIMLQNGHSVRLFLFETDDEEFHQCIDDLLAHYADQIVVVWFAGVEELVTKERDGLLVMSHLSYTKLSEDELVMRELSSLLVIRRNKNKGEKNERLEIG